MVSYKGHNFWKMIVFEFQISGDLQKAIFSQLGEEEGNLKNKNIDIIDIKVSYSDTTEDGNEYSRVVVIYTIK